MFRFLKYKIIPFSKSQPRVYSYNVLKIFLIFKRRYTYKMYSYKRKKKECLRKQKGKTPLPFGVLFYVLLPSDSLVLSFRQRKKLKSCYCIYPFQNLSFRLIIIIFLRFCKFQPRYTYKMYSYKRKRKSALESKREKPLNPLGYYFMSCWLVTR